MRELHALAGRLTITLGDASGRVVDERRADNLMTNAGRALLGRLLTGGAQLDASQGGDRDRLRHRHAERGRHRAGYAGRRSPASAAVPVADGGQMKVAVTATFPGAGLPQTQAVSEAGIELTPAGGATVLYNRVTFPPINRTPNLDMTLTWEVLF